MAVGEGVRDAPPERVLLVGFMAAGKTSVGVELAACLGWSHVDVDAAIEAREGRRIAEIFRESGEAAFRDLEAEAAAAALARRHVVVSPGGGWAEQPGGWEAVPEATLSVWLRVSHSEVLRRTRSGTARTDRPLLDGAGEDAVRRLLLRREPYYARATLHIQTDGRTAPAVAAEIESYVRGTAADPLNVAPED